MLDREADESRGAVDTGFAQRRGALARNSISGCLISATRRRVWRGEASKEIDPASIEQADIDRAVRTILAEFPRR